MACKFYAVEWSFTEKKTSVAQKDPDVLQVRRLSENNRYAPLQIIAMDETPVWSNIVPETTVDLIAKKTITMKPTGHEKKQSISVFSCEIQWLCSRVPSMKHLLWTRHLDNMLLLQAENMLGWTQLETVAFARCLLAWGSFECHIVQSVTSSLKSKTIIKQNIIWRSASWEIQDMDWNKMRNEFVIFRFYYKIIVRLTNYKYTVSTVTSYGRNSHLSRQQLTRSDLCGGMYVLWQEERWPDENIKEKA